MIYRTSTYPNHEGVPQSFCIDNYFESVTLFRQNYFNVDLNPESSNALEFWRNRTNSRQYMLGYGN